MRSTTLGPPLETYGPHIRITAITAGVGLFFCLLSFAVAHETDDKIAWRVFFVLCALFAGLLAWQLSFRAAVHESGISCQNMFISKELRWQEIERFYFGCHQVYAKHIPLGTFYQFKLHSILGPSLSLSNHVRNAEDLALRVARNTAKPLLEKAMQAFESGTVLDFGAIQVSPSEGVTLKKLLFDKKIQWKDITAYDANFSYFKFDLHKKLLSSWTIPSEKIANAHVLKLLLDSVMEQVWLRS